MWTSKQEIITAGKVQKITLWENEEQLTFEQFIQFLQKEDAFRNFFITLLKAAPYEAYFWETPPVWTDNINRPFEFVFVDSRTLPTIQADRFAFQEHYDKDQNGDEVVTFPNLRGDAQLVVPLPTVTSAAYAHLAAFVQSAAIGQQDKFWQYVGQAMAQRLSDKPLWLSTAGLGVSWLHIRLDSRPKYYRFQPYKSY